MLKGNRSTRKESLTVPEIMHEPIMVIHALVLLEHAYVTQLAVQHPLRDRRLRDICPVEVVHTISAHGPVLQLGGARSRRVFVEVARHSFKITL